MPLKMKPSRYDIYSTKESDKDWTFMDPPSAAKQSTEDLWLGRVESNELELEFK